MYSAAKAKLGTIFITAKELVIICQTLIYMYLPNTPTPIQTDNSTVVGVVNITIIAQKQIPWTCDCIGSDVVNPNNGFF